MSPPCQEENARRPENVSQHQAEQGPVFERDASDPMQQQERPSLERALPPDSAEDIRAPVILESPRSYSNAGPPAAGQSKGVDAATVDEASWLEQEQEQAAAANSKPHSQSRTGFTQHAPHSIQALDLARTPFAIKTVTLKPPPHLQAWQDDVKQSRTG